MNRDGFTSNSLLPPAASIHQIVSSPLIEVAISQHRVLMITSVLCSSPIASKLFFSSTEKRVIFLILRLNHFCFEPMDSCAQLDLVWCVERKGSTVSLTRLWKLSQIQSQSRIRLSERFNCHFCTQVTVYGAFATRAQEALLTVLPCSFA